MNQTKEQKKEAHTCASKYKKILKIISLQSP